MSDILSEFSEYNTKEAARYRVGAAVIDYLINTIFFFAFVIFFGEKVGERHEVHGPLGLVPLAFWFFYFIVFEKVFNGTLGNKIMGLKVVSLENTQVTFIQIFKRRICDIFDIVLSFGLVGYILIKHTRLNQRLGDIWAKTIVVREPK
jgi:uncharacterized RDD family membrane protein YckC